MSVETTHSHVTLGFVAQDPDAALRVLTDVLALADQAPEVSDDQLRRRLMELQSALAGHVEQQS